MSGVVDYIESIPEFDRDDSLLFSTFSFMLCPHKRTGIGGMFVTTQTLASEVSPIFRTGRLLLYPCQLWFLAEQ